MKKLEELLEWGGTKRDITFLILSAAALLASIFGFQPLPFDMAGYLSSYAESLSSWRLDRPDYRF